MNRKQRRTAAKLGHSSHGSGTEAAGTPDGTTSVLAKAIQHHQAGRLSEAEAHYRLVLAVEPANAEVLFNLAVAQRQQGKLHQAIDAYRKVITLKPNYTDAHFNLGNALMAHGMLEEAAVAYRRTIAINPDFADAYFNLGNALMVLSKPGEAAVAFRQAVESKPGFARAYGNLGIALQDLADNGGAIAAYRQAIAIDPGYAEAHYNLGNALRDEGNIDEAIAAYRTSIAIQAGFAEAHSNLANALSSQGKLDESISAYRSAIGLQPGNAELHYNLGNALKDQGRFDDAASAYHRAIGIKPDHADAHLNLAIVLTNQGKFRDAISEYREAIRLKPDDAGVYSNLLLSLHYDESTTPDQLSATHRGWDKRFAQQVPRSHSNHRAPDRRLKIGYVSPDFRAHSVAYFVEPLLRNHDRKIVDVFCYADVIRPDEVTARLQEHSDHWQMTLGISDDALAGCVRADAIDILVDLAGHTAFNRLGVFSRKPAPLQVTWLGYPNTTGLKAMDYRLVDAVTDPPGAADTSASEALVRLDGGFLCFGGARDAPEPADPPSLKSGVVTFGSFNNPAKLSSATLDAWAKLLVRLPQARLLLKGKSLADGATRTSFLARLAEHRIAPDRVELEGWLSTTTAHLAHYDRIDIALDPFPYNGTTTTCEALWMGVPVVVLSGDRHSGRVGASLLAQIGLDGWIARSVDEYVDMACALAGAPERLRDLRRSLRPRMVASPLCDGGAFARKIEAAYRKMWHAWCKPADKSGNPIGE